MAETASLSIRVSQEGADQAAASLRGLTQAGGGAEASFGKLAMQIAPAVTGDDEALAGQDASTQALIGYYRQHRK